METIIIKGIESTQTAKGEGLKVSYNGNRVASVAPWLKDEIAFIKKAGVGAEITCEIEYGQYNNIKKVDFTQVTRPTEPVEKEVVAEAKEKFQEAFNAATCMSVKDEFILAQVILKAAVELCKHEVAKGGNIGEHMTHAIDELVGSFKYALTSVKAL